MITRLQQALRQLHDLLTPAEEIFFTWLVRVMAAAVLVGSAWIDDAPPLDIAAIIIAFYVGVRVTTQVGRLVSVAPFKTEALKILFALVVLFLLGLSFLAVVTFVERLARSVVG